MFQTTPSYTVLTAAELVAGNDISSKNHGFIRIGGEVCLAKGRVHEVLGDSVESFVLSVAAAASGPVVWAGLGRDLASLCPAGMQPFIDPARLLITQGVSRADVLFAAEQALRCVGVACVVVQMEHGPDLKESRRLQLAAEEGGTIGLVLINGRAQTSAAETRWACNAITQDRHNAHMWQWACLKHRKGATGLWHVTWLSHAENGGEYGPGLIHMAAATAA